MSRSIRTPAVGVIAALIVIAGFSLTTMGAANSQVPTEPPSTTPDGTVQTDRLGGDTRFETSVEISQEAFPAGSTDVFLARADEFPDALSAGSLTTGPILLVPSCDDIPTVITDEIERLSPERVVALGGEDAVCQEVLDEAAAAAEQGTSGSPAPTETSTSSPSPTPTITETSTECPGVEVGGECIGEPDPSASPTPSETETMTP